MELLFPLRYKEDQQRDSQEAAEKAKLASMTDEERRRWELANPKVHLATNTGFLSYCVGFKSTCIWQFKQSCLPDVIAPCTCIECL